MNVIRCTPGNTHTQLQHDWIIDYTLFNQAVGQAQVSGIKNLDFRALSGLDLRRFGQGFCSARALIYPFFVTHVALLRDQSLEPLKQATLLPKNGDNPTTMGGSGDPFPCANARHRESGGEI